MLMKKVCACGCIACANGRGPPKKQKKNFFFFRPRSPTQKPKVFLIYAALTHNHTPSPCFLLHILVVFLGLSCLKCYTWECVILNRFGPVVDPLLWTDRPVHLQLFFASVVTVPVLAHKEFIEASPENNKPKKNRRMSRIETIQWEQRRANIKKRECEKTSFCYILN